MSSSENCLGLIHLTTADIEYRIARTRRERAAAFRLVYESYLRSGLGQPNPYRMRVTPYHLLPTTEVFIAVFRQTPIITMTLVMDGELGIPMECIYAAEVARKRQAGLRFGEVSCLADRRNRFRGFLPAFLGLSRLMAQYAWCRGLDELLVAVHPRHARFYRRFMAFEPFGGLRAYPTVRNRPALALALNFDRVDRQRPKSFDTFFGQWIPEEKLQPQPILPEDAEYFRPMVDPAFQAVPLEEIDFTSRSTRSDQVVPLG